MENPTPSLREQGLQALREGNADGAIDYLARAVMADGQDAEAQAFLGVAYSQKGMHAQAARALQTAVELRPSEARYRFNLGVALENGGDPPGAAIAYQETLRLNPEHPQARAKLQALGAAPPAPSAAPPGVGESRPAVPPSPWAAGAQGTSATIGPPGTVQCPSCQQWSKTGMSCEWCSSPLRPPATQGSAPWLQSSYTPGSGETAGAGVGVSYTPEMGAGEAFGRRFAAYFIDAILLGIVSQVLISVLGLNTQPAPGQMVDMAGLAGKFGTAFLLGLVLSAAYYGGMLSARGQTLGKMALGLRVVGPDGGNPSFLRACLRDIIGRWISGLVLCLGYFWMLWDAEQQTWHDKIASTHVERA